VMIGSIARLGAISAADSLYDTCSLAECQIVNAGTVYPGITVVRTAFDRSLSKCYHARASATTFTAASLTQITDVDFPDQLGTPLVVTGPIIQMNMIFHALTTSGVIYSSGGATGTGNDPTTWASTATINTYQDPDQSVTLARYKHHILAFGTNSVEFFNDEGIPAPASPLQRTEQAAIRFGTIGPKTVINVADTIYWLSSGRNNTIGLWKMDGYEPVRVSTPREDVKLAGARGTGSGYALDSVSLVCLSMAGKEHIGINGVFSYPIAWYMKNSTSTKWGSTSDTNTDYQHATCLQSGVCLYNTRDKVWWNMMTWVDDDADGTALGGVMGILPVTPYLGPSLSPEYSDITVFLFPKLSPASTSTSTRLQSVGWIKNPGPAWGDWSDATSGNFAQEWPMIVQFNPLDFGNSKRKRIHRAELVLSKTPYANGTSQYINLLANRADNPRPTTANITAGFLLRSIEVPYSSISSVVDATSPAEPLEYQGMLDRYYVNNLGIGRKWQLSVLYGGSSDLCLEALELTVSQCTS
jgi:hypothetical protein